MAEKQAARIPWPQLLRARELYVKWQAFVLWVRAIEESEGNFPDWLTETVSKCCPGFRQFLETQKVKGSRNPASLWPCLEQWINERIFSKPGQESWMDAVGYYAVRDLAALRDEAYWHYCVREWKRSKPSVYPAFRQWRKDSKNCSDEALDTFETTEDLRQLLKLSKRAGPRMLSKWVDLYVEWQAFAYWVRLALGMCEPSPDTVRRELRRRCPGFVADSAPLQGHERKTHDQHFNALLRWIEEREFTRPHKEGWLPVVLYQARLHPRYQRVVGYWHHWQWLRSRRPHSRYSSFARWKAAADGYTAEAEVD
jgi:hypothetical protein